MFRGGLLLLLLILVLVGMGQTPGLIIKPATGEGTSVLDPNGDGYTSLDATGYQSNDVFESEIPFNSLVRPDPSGDPVIGPTGMFNEIVGTDAVGRDAVMTYMDGVNLIFRFRLGGYAPNSKTYSILIDSDQLFGFIGSGADPNPVPGNPGFEVEISLHTNFSVSVYNVNDKITPSLITSYSYDTHCQKSIAYTSNGGDADYFYDFFVPISALSSVGIDASTPLRFVSLTTMNPNPAIGSNSQSDIGGTSSGTNLDQVFTDLIGGQTPTVPGQDVLDRSTCPVINSPLSSGTTNVTGTSLEPDGSTIRVYSNGSLVGTGTVSSGAWSVTVSSPLVSDAIVTATVQETGEGESSSTCNSEIVGAICLDPPYNLSIVPGNKGIEYSIVAIANTTVTLFYENGTPVNITGTYPNPQTFAVAGTYSGRISYQTGNSLPDGRYYITANRSGSCASAKVWFCVGSTGQTETPVITTSPITTATSSIAGTGVVNATVYLYSGGTHIGTGTVNSSGNWSITPIVALSNCMAIYASQLSATTSLCMSNFTTPVYVDNGETCVPPIIYGADCVPSAPVISVSGFSVEAAGAVIQLFNASTNALLGSTTVLSNGSWTITGVSLSAGTSIYAKATDTPNCRATSIASNIVLIKTQASNAGLSITTNPIVENVTNSITGAGTNGFTVELYQDGVDLLGSAVVSGGVWTISVNASLLTAGSTITASQYSGANCLSAPSVGRIVQCQAPSTTFSLSPVEPGYCEQEFGQFTISPTVTGVIYTPVLSATLATSGYSSIGTGGPVTLITYGLVTDPTDFKVKATKISGLTCEAVGSSTVSLTMYPNPSKTLVVSPASTTICAGSNFDITIYGSEIGTSYQLREASTGQNLGTEQPGNGGALVLNTGAVYNTGNIKVVAVRMYGSAACEVDLNNQVAVTVTGPATNQLVTVSPALLCDPATVSISIETNNDGLTYRIYQQSNNALVGSFTGNGSIRSVASGVVSATETFYVLITGGGCTDVRLQNTATVNFSNLSVSNAAITPVSCYGGNTGAISLTTSGGLNSPQFLWSNGATTANISGLYAGTFSVTITDGGNCPKTYEYTVSQPNELLINPSVVQNEVNGDDGIFSIAYSGGTANYNLEWTRISPASPLVQGSVSGLTTLDNPYFISNLPEGDYNITIIDARGCNKAVSANITTASCQIVNHLVTQVSCYGGADGAIDLLVGGTASQFRYDWHDLIGTDDPQDRTGLSAGTYTVTVTCVDEAFSVDYAIVITEPATALSVSGTATNVSCYGLSDGAISITPSGGTPGYTYLWSGPASFSSASQNLTGRLPGTYTVLITDLKGCTVQESFVVTQPDPLSITLVPTDATSYGTATGSIQATITGGTSPYSYLWSNSATTKDLTDILAGTYQLTVTDANNCINDAFTNVNQPVDATSNCAYTIGDNFNLGGYSGNNSTGNLVWGSNWIITNGATNVDVAAVTCPENSNALRMGSLDGSNASFDAIIVRSADLSLFTGFATLSFDYCTSNSSADATRVDITLKRSGNTSLTQYTIASNTSDAISITINNTYLVSDFELIIRAYSVGNSKNHIRIDNVKIASTKNFKVIATPTNVTCFGGSNGSISTSVSSSEPGISPYTYLWNTGATSNNITGLSAGMYSVNVSDDGGCSVPVNGIVVAQPAQLVATLSVVHPSCPAFSDGIISVLAPSNGNGSGYQYKFTTATDVILSDWSSTSSITNRPSGTYKVYIRNGDGTCETTLSTNTTLTGVDVTNPVVACPANIVKNTNGGNCSANVNIPGPTIATDNCDASPLLTWSSTGAKVANGTGTISNALSPIPTGVTEITYTLTDAAGNHSSCSFTVTVNSDVNVTGLGTLVSNVCQGNSTTAFVSGSLVDGSYTVSYSLGDANVSGPHTATLTVAGGTGGSSFSIPSTQLNNAGSTTFTVNSITSNTTTCESIVLGLSAIFTVSSTPDAPSGSANQSFCSYENATVNDLVITGTQIKWYDASSGGSQLLGSTSLTNGTTYYASQSSGGCESINRFGVTVTIYSPPTIVSTTNASRCGTGSVTLEATASAGIVNWYDAPTGGTLLGTGTSFTTTSLTNTTSYWVAAVDNGCETQTRTEVIATIYTIPTITSVTGASRCGIGSVTLNADASAGTINWYAAASGGSSSGTGTSFTTPSLSATTTYYVDATDNGCTTASRTPVTATIYAIPTITASNGDSRCGSGLVSLTATPSAGNVDWYDASSGGNLLYSGTNYTPNIASTTTFYAEATNNGCVSTSRTAITGIVISYPSGSLVSSDADNTICDGQSVTFQANGGTNYNFLLNGSSVQNGALTTYINNTLSDGDQVSVEVTNSGCSATYPAITVSVIASPTISLGANPTACSGDISSDFVYTATTGSPDEYSIVWDADALTAGFVNVSSKELTASPVVLTIPVGVANGSYQGTLYVSNSSTGCSSTGYSFSLTVSACTTAPVATDDIYATEYNTSLTGLAILANDTDDDGIDVASVILNPGGTNTPTGTSYTDASGNQWLVGLDGLLSFTPATDFAGTATVSYTVNDIGSPTAVSNVATISVTILRIICPAGGDLGCNPATVPDEGTPTYVESGLWQRTSNLTQTILTSLGCNQTKTYRFTSEWKINGTHGSKILTCDQVYTYITDTEDPTFSTCPANQTVASNHAGGTYLVSGTALDAVAADNCSVASLVHNYDGGGSTLDGKTFPAGVTTVIWTATDVCGHTATCTYTITVSSINAVVSDVSDDLTDDCPDLLAPFNADNDAYNAGVSQVKFKVERQNSTANWSFDFAITGADVTVYNLTIDGDGVAASPTQTVGDNDNGTINADANGYVTFTLEVVNLPGTQLEVTLTISNVADTHGNESDTSDNEEMHVILPMPVVGAFTN